MPRRATQGSLELLLGDGGVYLSSYTCHTLSQQLLLVVGQLLLQLLQLRAYLLLLAGECG